MKRAFSVLALMLTLSMMTAVAQRQGPLPDPMCGIDGCFAAKLKQGPIPDPMCGVDGCFTGNLK